MDASGDIDSEYSIKVTVDYFHSDSETYYVPVPGGTHSWQFIVGQIIPDEPIKRATYVIYNKWNVMTVHVCV